MRISKNAFSKKVSDRYVEFNLPNFNFLCQILTKREVFLLRYPTYGKEIGIRSELYWLI